MLTPGTCSWLMRSLSVVQGWGSSLTTTAGRRHEATLSIRCCTSGGTDCGVDEVWAIRICAEKQSTAPSAPTFDTGIIESLLGIGALVRGRRATIGRPQLTARLYTEFYFEDADTVCAKCNGESQCPGPPHRNPFMYRISSTWRPHSRMRGRLACRSRSHCPSLS